MEQLTILEVDAINVQDKVSKANKPYKSIGLKSADQWYNGFGNQTAEWAEKVKVGDKVQVIVWEEEYNGKTNMKFKPQSPVDKLRGEFLEMKDLVNKLIKLNNLQWK